MAMTMMFMTMTTMTMTTMTMTTMTIYLWFGPTSVSEVSLLYAYYCTVYSTVYTLYSIFFLATIL